MQEDHRDHGVRGPAVHVAQDNAEGHRTAQVKHAVVGLRGRRHIIEHEQDAGDREDDEEEKADQPQAHGVSRPQGLLADTYRLDMQKEVAEAGGCAPAI